MFNVAFDTSLTLNPTTLILTVLVLTQNIRANEVFSGVFHVSLTTDSRDTISNCSFLLR